MKLVLQVDLGPGHIVLDGDPASPSPRGGKGEGELGPSLTWENWEPPISCF